MLRYVYLDYKIRYKQMFKNNMIINDMINQQTIDFIKQFK